METPSTHENLIWGLCQLQCKPHQVLGIIHLMIIYLYIRYLTRMQVRTSAATVLIYLSHCKTSVYVQHIPWIMHIFCCSLLYCRFIISSVWIHVIYVPLFLRVAPPVGSGTPAFRLGSRIDPHRHRGVVKVHWRVPWVGGLFSWVVATFTL